MGHIFKEALHHYYPPVDVSEAHAMCLLGRECNVKNKPQECGIIVQKWIVLRGGCWKHQPTTNNPSFAAFRTCQNIRKDQNKISLFKKKKKILI